MKKEELTIEEAEEIAEIQALLNKAMAQEQYLINIFQDKE